MRFGGNKNPHLAWSGVPEDAQSLVLLCIDPDVPSSADDVNQEGVSVPASLPRVDFYHWVMINIPPALSHIEAGSCSDGVTANGKSAPDGPAGALQGVNGYTDFLAGSELAGTYLGYDGPCPPWNDEIIHHYHFRLYALDLPSLNLGGQFDGDQVRAAMAGHILDEAEIMGTYTLNPSVTG